MAPLFAKCFLLFGALISWCYGDGVQKHPLQNMTITDVPVKVYQGNFQCVQQRLSESLNVLSNFFPPIESCNVCSEKDYMNNEMITNFYSSRHCVEKSYECGSITDLGGELMGQLEKISKFINSYPTTCLDIKQKSNLSLSGYYIIRAPNGSLTSVYCDMEGSNCDGKGGWMRVGYLNMTDPGATCPPGMTLRQFNTISHGLCGRPTSASIFYSSHGYHYNKICGQIKAYQFGTPDGFPPLHGIYVSPNIENCNTYVDGISITYGNNPRKHIWTYACGAREKIEISIDAAQYNCPCNINSTGTTVPSFVGSNYYCESALSPGLPYLSVLYPNDPLWDGQGCEGEEEPCCTNPNMPWFVTTLNETTSEDIELRMCGSEHSGDEDTPIEVIDLYIR